MNQPQAPASLYKTLLRIVFAAAAVIILLWLLARTYHMVLVLLFALVLAIVINTPVARLETKGIKRGWAALIVFGAIAIALALIGWLVVPKVMEQLRTLIANLPGYAAVLQDKMSKLQEAFPDLDGKPGNNSLDPANWLPSISEAINRLTNFSLTVLQSVLLLIIFFSLVVYAVVNPKPLLEIYFSLFPPHKRDRAATAYANASVMLTGWLKSNLIGGVISGIATTIVLSLLGVPGAWVWGALALFSELIPRLGFYISAVPPTLVALSISNTTALWVGIFFIAMDEIMADVVMPQIRSNAMNIHPVSILFLVMAFGAAFGFIGILLATPMAAIIKAYYEEFYMHHQAPDPDWKERIQRAVSGGK
ncbi:AI-2E family transporter [Paracnuella aquatica]|nr:AI-2E family transporter [Paracnuella aquatica]